MNYREALLVSVGDSVIAKRTGAVLVVDKILHLSDQRGVEFIGVSLNSVT